VASPLPTTTNVPPSATPQPLAAQVNGEEISLEQFQAELARYQAAVGTELATEDQQKVLDDLIDQLLLAQGAAEAGFTVDEQTLQTRLDALVESLGSPEALANWMEEQGYSEESFRRDLSRSIAAAWMRDQVIASVPETAEQVHVRQILQLNAAEAEGSLAQISSGADFGQLAAAADPLTGGDLGWFPQGYLLDPKLDEAAFSLQPGEHSQVIQTGAGYHILQVLERDPERPLDPDARLVLQSQALEDWLAARRSQSEIEIFIER
jgi:parvulin-like peptidyl-prolyl isomerase